MLPVGEALVPAGFVKAQQLLEIPHALAIIDDAQHLFLREVLNADVARAGAAGVLQQFGDQCEPVREGIALVAQCAFLVEADLDLHGDLLKGQRLPAQRASPLAG